MAAYNYGVDNNVTYNQSVVAHVNDVTEETAVDVLDDGASADLVMMMMMLMMTIYDDDDDGDDDRAGADLAGVGVLGFADPLRSDL